jgi:hypothetical protein
VNSLVLLFFVELSLAGDGNRVIVNRDADVLFLHGRQIGANEILGVRRIVTRADKFSTYATDRCNLMGISLSDNPWKTNGMDAGSYGRFGLSCGSLYVRRRTEDVGLL